MFHLTGSEIAGTLFICVIVAVVVFRTAKFIELKQKSRRAFYVFAVYVCSIFLFALPYCAMYRGNPNCFAFTTELREQRAAEIKDEEKQRLALFSDRLAQARQADAELAAALDAIKRNPVVPKPDSKTVGHCYVQFPGKQGTVEIDLAQGPGRNSATGQFYAPHSVSVVFPLMRGLGSSWSVPVEYPIRQKNQSDQEWNVLVDEVLLPKDIAAYAKLIERALIASRATVLITEGAMFKPKGADESLPWELADFYYFSAITQTTVGYGDIVPNSRSVRMVVLGQVLWSVFLLSVVLAIVLGEAEK